MTGQNLRLNLHFSGELINVLEARSRKFKSWSAYVKALIRLDATNPADVETLALIAGLSSAERDQFDREVLKRQKIQLDAEREEERRREEKRHSTGKFWNQK